MAGELVIIRFPDGDVEFTAGSAPPSVGERITKRGAEWLVARVDQPTRECFAITVMPVDVERDASWPTPYAAST